MKNVQSLKWEELRWFIAVKRTYRSIGRLFMDNTVAAWGSALIASTFKVNDTFAEIQKVVWFIFFKFWKKKKKKRFKCQTDLPYSTL